MMDTQVQMLDRLRKGMRIKTVSGVIGRIKEIREEFGGMRTVIIETGNDKYSSFLQLDINAIMEVVAEDIPQIEPEEQPEEKPVEQPAIEPASPEENFDAAEFVNASNNTRKPTKPKSTTQKPRSTGRQKK